MGEFRLNRLVAEPSQDVLGSSLVDAAHLSLLDLLYMTCVCFIIEVSYLLTMAYRRRVCCKSKKQLGFVVDTSIMVRLCFAANSLFL